MEHVHKLEAQVAIWYKDMPRLPENMKVWLATNLWWIVLVLVILGALGVLGVLMITFFASAVLVGVAGVAGAAVSGVVTIVVILSLIFSALSLIVSAMAIPHLKEMRRKGWTLLFVASLIDVVSIVVSLISSLNILSFLWSVVLLGATLYFLFEVRDKFGPVAKRKVEAPVTSKL